MGQVCGVVMHVWCCLRADKDCLHAQGAGDGKVAGVILDQGGCGWVKAVYSNEGGDGLRGGFGMKTGLFDAINGVKGGGEATGAQDGMGIRGGAVGKDDATAGKGFYRFGELGVWGEAGH